MLAVDDIRASDFDTVIVASVDLQGRLFGRHVPQELFEREPERHIEICTCALAWDTRQDLALATPFAGWHTGWHDFWLRPDLTTLRMYPGRPRTALCMADCVDGDGMLLPVAPRTILRRQIERSQAAGYDLLMASELEFSLFQGTVREARLRGFRDLEPTTLVHSDYTITAQIAQEPLLASIRRSLKEADIPVLGMQSEFALGQWEINLEHTEPMEMADRHVIYKACVKEAAFRYGLSVTFMPKPVASEQGNSCHVHCSLWKGGEPLFLSPDDPSQMSAHAREFLGGLMHYLDDTALFFAPHVNSFKRHATEDVGGGINAWGHDNRTVTFRTVGHGRSFHLEDRYPGADANPYLVFAALAAAGLEGMARGLDPGPPFIGNAYACSELRRAPANLGAAVEAFEGSHFAVATFGQEVVDHYATIARGEWLTFSRAVTDWELASDFEGV